MQFDDFDCELQVEEVYSDEQKEFFYYSVFSCCHGQLSYLDDAVFTAKDVTKYTEGIPGCKNLSLDQKFDYLIKEWNTSQWNSPMKYFYARSS